MASSASVRGEGRGAAGGTTRARSRTHPPGGAQRSPQPPSGAATQPMATAREQPGKGTGVALGSPASTSAHPPARQGPPQQRGPAHPSPTPLSGRCPRRSPRCGRGCGMPACGRRGSRPDGASASPGSANPASAEPGSRFCFLMGHRHPSEGRESTVPERGFVTALHRPSKRGGVSKPHHGEAQASDPP